MGNRIAKHIYSDNAFTQWENAAYYVRDASGSVMAAYEREATGQTPPSSFRVAERHLYGSSRLGIDATPYELMATNFTKPTGPSSHFCKRFVLNITPILTKKCKLKHQLYLLLTSRYLVVKQIILIFAQHIFLILTRHQILILEQRRILMKQQA